MSLGDVMCKYKHIGTDMNICPYKKNKSFGCSFRAKADLRSDKVRAHWHSYKKSLEPES